MKNTTEYIGYRSGPNTIMALACAALGVQVGTLTVQYPEAGEVIFIVRNIGKGGLLGKHYRTLLYTEVGRDSEAKKTHWEGLMGVKVADLGKWDLEMEKQP